jgi:hypothetical protein
MRNVPVTCAALSLLITALVAPAAPPVPISKEAQAKAGHAELYVLPLKIDAVTFASSWTPCAPLPGYVPAPGSGNLLATSPATVGFCGIATVRLKKTSPNANLAGKAVTIQVTEQHNNLTPWQTQVGLYTLPFPSSGDTLAYPRVAIGSFPGDNPAIPASITTNRKRAMDADYSFRGGRPVLVELMNNGQAVDKKSCTFKTTSSPNGPGSAQLTCP